MTIGFGMHPPFLVAVSAVHTVISASPVPLTLNGAGKAMALKYPAGTDESFSLLLPNSENEGIVSLYKVYKAAVPT
jgi:hypothetical protein